MTRLRMSQGRAQTFCASLRNRNARQDFTSATLCNRNASQDFTRATSCGNLQENAAAQIEPRTRTHTLCGPAQSKRMSKFYTRRFIRKITGNRPQKRVSTLIKHQPSHLPSEPLSVDTTVWGRMLLHSSCQINSDLQPNILSNIFSLTHILVLSPARSTIFSTFYLYMLST